MRLILALFDAMKTFDRPATRRELERESGLTKDEFHAGVRGLARRDLIIKDVLPRQAGTYRLRHGAERPTEMRGKFERSAAVREQHSQAKLAYYAAQRRYSAAAPPAARNAPGALRVVVKGVLDIRAHQHEAGGMRQCALADAWKKR